MTEDTRPIYAAYELEIRTDAYPSFEDDPEGSQKFDDTIDESVDATVEALQNRLREHLNDPHLTVTCKS
jgi:hypothetical protein